MSPERAIFGIIVFFVPTGAVLFGLFAMGVIYLRKPPPEEPPSEKKRLPGSDNHPKK
jgi:hypothetical protein